jgi:hypothetical protein
MLPLMAEQRDVLFNKTTFGDKNYSIQSKAVATEDQICKRVVPETCKEAT